MLSSAYLMQPCIDQENIFFVTDDDIWKVLKKGGMASRLTSQLGICSSPIVSPDGRHIVFVSTDAGAADLYLMPASGGEVKRLTYQGNPYPVRWLDNKKIVFYSDQDIYQTRRNVRLYSLDIKTFETKELPFGSATHVDFNKGGMVVIARNGGDPARWKRYRGGTAGHLWIKNRVRTNLKNFCQK